MSHRKHRSLPVRSNAIDHRTSIRRQLQLIPNRRDQQILRRSRFLRIDATNLEILHTLHRSHRLPVHPVLTHDAMIVRHSPRENRSNRRSPIHISRRILRIAEEHPLAHQALEAVLPIERRKSVHIVRAQLIYRKTNHEPRHRRLGLSRKRSSQYSQHCCYRRTFHLFSINFSLFPSHFSLFPSIYSPLPSERGWG